MKIRMIAVILAGIICQALSACSAEQIYATGKNWQRLQCANTPDAQQRDRCYQEADVPYATYKRELDSVRTAK